MNCGNCQSSLTCSCQTRIASDGKQVCSNCIAQYEQRLLSLKLEQDRAKALTRQ